MAIASINGEPLEANAYDAKTKVVVDSTALSGTKTNGAAWDATNNMTTAGNQYHFVEYSLSGLGAVVVSVKGASYGNRWPLITFYDSNNNILDKVWNASMKLYDGELVSVPSSATRCIVNGYVINQAALDMLLFGSKTQYNVNAELAAQIESLSNTSVSTDDVVVLRTTTLEGALTVGEAWRTDGGTRPTGGYEYAEYDLSTIDASELIVSGSSWGEPFPLIAFYDSGSNLISQYGTTGNTDWHDETVNVPSGAVTCFVNGSQGSRPDPLVKYKAVTETQNDVNVRIEGILSEAGIQAKKYLFIGDSYSQGYSHDGSNDGWPVYLAEYMGLNSTQYGMSRRGGASFTNSSNSFLQLLQSASGSGYTDIVVCGGFNDYSKTQAQIEAGISEFYDAAMELYPSARVHVGAIGYIKQGSGESAYSNWQEVRTKIETIVIPSYQASIKYGCRYLTNVEYMLSEDGLTPTDGYHPNEAGNRAIALGIANALLTGSAPLPYNADMRAQ